MKFFVFRIKKNIPDLLAYSCASRLLCLKYFAALQGFSLSSWVLFPQPSSPSNVISFPDCIESKYKLLRKEFISFPQLL